jgi:hypothetical protein
MSVDDVLKWVPVGVAGFAGVSLLINARSFRRTRKLEQIKLAESILKDIRDLEEKIDEIKDKIHLQDWGRKFFNIVEWLSFLINNHHINDKTLINYFKPSYKTWHEEWFNYEYLEKDLRDDKKTYEEFRKLFDHFRMGENWKDCKCCDCAKD